MKLARIAIRNIGRNRRRSILSAVATAMATMSMVALASYINGMRLDMQANVSDFVTGHVQVRHADYDRYEQLNPLHLRVERPDELLARLDADPGHRRRPSPGFPSPWGSSGGRKPPEPWPWAWTCSGKAGSCGWTGSSGRGACPSRRGERGGCSGRRSRSPSG